MTAAEGGAGPARLNPFAFPSDTGIRFGLLVVLIACGSVQRWYGIATDVFDLAPRLRACMGGGAILSDAVLHPGALEPVLMACWFPMMRAAVLPCIAAGLALLAGATWLIYAAHPWWQVRRLRLERLDPHEAPELAAELDALCRTAGLRHAPEVWWNVLDGRPLALAFGTGRRRRVALTGAVALLLRTDPAAFRVVLLHELAHIRNGDVGLAYLTLSLWWAFLTTALLPYAVINLAQRPGVPDLILLAATAGALVLCVLLTRNAVLRARELYADARSLVWHRDAAGLARVLEGLRPIPRWRRLLSPHPAPSRRRRLAGDTDEMFRFGTWDAFGAGLAGGLAGPFLALLAALITNILHPAEVVPAFLAASVAVLVAVAMAAGAAALGTWRAAFFALMRRRGRAPTLRVAAACAAGGVLGGVGPPAAAALATAAGVGSAAGWVQPMEIGLPLLILASAAACLVLMLALILWLAAFLAWVEATARCWLSASLPGSTPGPAFTLGLASCLAIAVPYVAFVPAFVGAWAFLQGQALSGTLGMFWYASFIVQVPPFGALAWFGVVALWVFPLSAALWPRRRGAASWVFLDPATPGPESLPTVPIRLHRAVLLGAAGGVAALLAAGWVRFPPEPATGQAGADALARLAPHLLTGVAAQGLVAVLTAFAVPRLAVPHAMCAAFVTGSLFAAGELLHRRPALYGQASFGDAAGIVLPFVLFDGALAALLCAGAAGLLAAAARRLRARGGRPGREPCHSSAE